MADFWDGLSKSCLMVLLSEIGDKTFFIAAVMAMRNPRGEVLVGALGALVVMTALSAGMGWVAPNLIDKFYTNLAAVGLFFFFGFRLIYENYEDKGGAGDWEELKEVEAELSSPKHNFDLESKSKTRKGAKSQLRRKLGMIISPIVMEVFTLTFLAEWGDRSQLATIGLAASTNVVGVTLGGIIGHSVCTSVAVLGGRHFATSLSERMVGLGGGLLFVLFGLHALIYG